MTKIEWKISVYHNEMSRLHCKKTLIFWLEICAMYQINIKIFKQSGIIQF